MSDNIYLYPTDTVWGIGANIHSEIGQRRIAEIKNTDYEKPLSVMFHTMDFLKSYVMLPEGFDDNWFEKFFALQTSLLLKTQYLKQKIGRSVLGHSEYISLRVVNNKAIREIIEREQAPISSTSCNVSGEPPIVDDRTIQEFQEKFAKDAFIISGDRPLSGFSSTMVVYDDQRFKVIREGKRCQEVMAFLKK